MKSIKNYYIAAACCACAVLPGHMTAQEANDSTKANFFNAMDYIRQKRYIPEGRKVDPQAKGRNVSVSAFGGASKLAGEGSWMPMSKEFGVSLTKDVTSFNSYRLTLEGAQNKQMKRGGVEIAHLFRIMDYVWGNNDRTAWNVETVIGLGGIHDPADKGRQPALCRGPLRGAARELPAGQPPGDVCRTASQPLYRRH